MKILKNLLNAGFVKDHSSKKSENFIELLPSAQSSSENENSLSASKNLLKNRNWNFSPAHYFTSKLEFASNILWMIVGNKKNQFHDPNLKPYLKLKL